MKPRPTASAAVREVLLNVTSNAARTLITICLSAAAGACVILATASNVDDIVLAHDAQQLRGLSTLSITSLDGRPISASACDAISSVGSVVASGGGIWTKDITVANGATPIKVRYVTPGYLAIAYPEQSMRAVTSVAGKDLVEEIGVTPGATLRASTPNDGEFPIDAVANNPSRVSGINRDLLMAVAPLGNVSECLVEASDGQAERVSSLVPSFFSTQVVVRAFLQSGDIDRNPAQELAYRWSRIVWIAVAGAMIALTAPAWAARRQEAALYRLLGFDRRSLGAVVALETLVTTVAPAQIASVWVLAIIKVSGGHVTLTALAADSSRSMLALSLCPVVAVAIALTGSTVNRLKGQ